MSTHCGIAVKSGNKYKTIYCHWDGYPSYMLPMLKNNYSSEELANKLVNLGDASIINKNLEPIGLHTFKHPEKDVSVFYHRDRGEDWEDVEPRFYTAVQLFTTYYYVYIFEDGEWNCYINGEPGGTIY